MPARPTLAQKNWLKRGLSQPGGKLPLFDGNGRKVNARVIRACIERGWAAPWFTNPLKPDWLVCKLTTAGATVAQERSLHNVAEMATATPAADCVD